MLILHASVVAVLGEDYTLPSSLQLTFSSGEVIGNTSCVVFGIINDGNLESLHRFIVSVEAVTPIGPLISYGGGTMSAVVIFDDEGMYCVVHNDYRYIPPKTSRMTGLS